MGNGITVLAGIAGIIALVTSGLYLTVAWTTWQAPADGGRVFAGLLGLLAALNLGSAALAGWRALHASGGLVPALISLGLSALMIFLAVSLTR